MLTGRNHAYRMSDETPVEEELSCEQKLSGLLRRFGLDFYLVAAFPASQAPAFADSLVASNWPTGLIKAYDRSGCYKESALVRRLRDTLQPLSFSEWPFLDGRLQGNAAPIDVSGGFERTLAFAIQDRDRQRLIFAFSGRRRPLGEDEVAMLYLSCLALVDDGLGLSRPLPAEPLSGRELDCLRWSAEGKSSDEIAIILDISPHTVVSYLKNALRKLGAVNRMQAIARACRLGLI